MADSVTYILKGHGHIDPLWVKQCFGLFKAQGICIRKLLLMKNGNPACFSMLEIHFVLPESMAGGNAAVFLEILNGQLLQQDWIEQTLTLV